jgi:enoyl-CoA hydratase/carnithine racemase
MSSNEPTILLEKRDQIAYITFNRPERLNAIRPQEYELFHEIVNDCDSDENIRAMIVTGKGRAWCAGDDIKAYPGGPEAPPVPKIPLSPVDQLIERTSAYQPHILVPTLLKIYESGTISIAAVNGVCWLPEILFAMDFVIAADVARFGGGDVRMGIVPGGTSTQILPRLLGRRRAIEFLLLSEEFSAEDAYRIGIVNKVVPLDQLMPEAEALAKKIIAHPLLAVQLTKRAITKAQDLPLNEGLELEDWYYRLSAQKGTVGDFAQRFLTKKR